MTSETFAAYCHRIRLENNPARLAAIRAELDRDNPVGSDSNALVLPVTLNQARVLQAN